jgi:hypothetical protein
LILALSCLWATAVPAGAAVPGAVSAITWGQSRTDVDREIELLRSNGARYIRANVNWAALEPDRKGTLDAGALSNYDYAIDRAIAAGLEVIMPISDGVPYWASGDPRKYVDASGARRWDRFHPPASFADYGDVVRKVADHYAPRGVHIYEIWNEPNLHYFWSSGPDPAQYAQMLRAGYTAVKAADPASTVLFGGLSKNDFEFLEGVYRAGGKGYFDAVAVHPYTYGVDPTVSWNGVNAGENPARLSKNSFPAIKEIRRSMEAYGDAAKGVWITEFGYSTTSGDGGVSAATQATFLTKAFKYTEQFPWLKAMLWYSARNNPWSADHDDYEAQFGLVTSTWQPKPALTAFKDYAATQAVTPAPTPTATPTATPSPTPTATPSPTATPTATPTPPGNAAPTVAFESPLEGATFTSGLTFQARAADDVRIDRVEFRVDGKLVATTRSSPYRASWKAHPKLAYGDHRVTATAYDGAGLSAVAAVTVTRVRTRALTARAPSVSSTAPPRVVVKGTVPSRLAQKGRVFVEVQRRSRAARRWSTHRRARTALLGSRYRATVRARGGRWRVRVVAAGVRGAAWASPYRGFSV